jgi:uncharacterized membrane protein YbhN (UPF0104 family)
LATSVGIPLKRSLVAFPVSAVAAVVAGATLASGLALDTSQPAWIRWLALCGLGTTVLLHRGLMAKTLDVLRRFVHRVPSADQLPTQRDIVVFYLWALVTIGALCGAFTVLLASLSDEPRPALVFCAFAASWTVGFLAVPIPAGIGVREALLVALIPDAGTAPLLAASLALRLLTIGTELLALAGNRIASRWSARYRSDAAATPRPAHSSISRSGSGLGG